MRSDVSQPQGLTVLSCTLQPDFTPTPGAFVAPVTYNSLLEGEPETAETAQQNATEVLMQLLDCLETEGLSDGVTALDITDLSKISFTYQDRIQVLVGNSNRMDYKVRLAGVAILDPDKGLAASDKGTLDVSYQQTDGEIKGYFAPDEPDPTPTPTPAEGEEGEGASSEATTDNSEEE